MATYDPVAHDYAQAFPTIQLRLFEWPWLEKKFSTIQGTSALDLGCGHGYLLPELRLRYSQVSGVEPSANMRREAQGYLDAWDQLQAPEGEPIKLLEGRGSHIPLTEGSQDLVVSLLSFRYMDWGKTLREVYRVLKPRGHFLLVDLFVQDNPFWNLPAILWDVLRVALAKRGQKDFQNKLKHLNLSEGWQSMVKENPKRQEAELQNTYSGGLTRLERRVLGQSLRGKIIAYHWQKDPE
jgi:SAM-dependent methyltransferase